MLNVGLITYWEPRFIISDTVSKIKQSKESYLLTKILILNIHENVIYLLFPFQIVTSFSLFFIILSVLSISLQSIYFYYSNKDEALSEDLAITVKIIDIVCFTWFTLELLLRFFVYCPNRKRFFLMLSNWVDIITVVTYIPQFIQLAVKGSLTEEVEIIASIRVLRLFRFFRLSSGLEVLKHTMIASSKEIMLLLLLLMIPVTLFATIVYFCERRVSIDTSSSLNLALLSFLVLATVFMLLL